MTNPFRPRLAVVSLSISPTLLHRSVRRRLPPEAVGRPSSDAVGLARTRSSVGAAAGRSRFFLLGASSSSLDTLDTLDHCFSQAAGQESPRGETLDSKGLDRQ